MTSKQASKPAEHAMRTKVEEEVTNEKDVNRSLKVPLQALRLLVQCMRHRGKRQSRQRRQDK